jgi:hypothetical protein
MSLARDWADLEGWCDINNGYFADGAQRHKLACGVFAVVSAPGWLRSAHAAMRGDPRANSRRLGFLPILNNLIN